MEKDQIDTDVLIVGGGPAGLSTAIRLAQLNKNSSNKLKICLLEKSTYFGGHTLSGACFEPTALNELIPDWKSFSNKPIFTSITSDVINFLSSTSSYSIPIPPWFPVSNSGNYIISLGNFVNWLSKIAEDLDIELYSGIGASEILFDKNGFVVGIGTSDVGINKDGTPKNNFERGVAIKSKFTVFAEGCHGSLSKQIIQKYNLKKESLPQKYSLGLKEMWLIDPLKHKSGYVEHNIGFPLDKNTYGGSFIYHQNDGPLIMLGLIVSLNYKNPYTNLFKELQLLKTHPKFQNLLKGGERIGYGARVLNEGGFQLIFPGGCLVGCSAGFLNISKLKGIHTAMKSGMVAAESIFETLQKFDYQKPIILNNYETNLKNSWVYKELKESRNIRPSFDIKLGFNLGIYGMMIYTGLIYPFLKGQENYTAKWKKHDYEYLLPAKFCKKKNYPKPDNKITFDLMSSLALTNTNHEHNQPSHLVLTDDEIPQSINFKIFDGPEQRYCPAGVYEFVKNSKNQQKILQINSQNCIHCKACDIKDPSQNINWVVPENGGGPGYSDM